jgi:hypothetical protein
LVLVVCGRCEERGDLRCCASCLAIEVSAGSLWKVGPRPICECERERELNLWGGSKGQVSKTARSHVQRRRKGREDDLGMDEPKSDINIQIKTIN